MPFSHTPQRFEPISPIATVKSVTTEVLDLNASNLDCKKVAEQLAQNQQLQREELASREALLEKIENDNLNDKLEMRTRHEQAVEHNKQLSNQLTEKIRADQLREDEVRADLEAQEKAEQAYEEMLRQEAENLRIKEKQLKNLTYYRSSQPYSNSSRNIYVKFYDKKAIMQRQPLQQDTEYSMNQIFPEELQLNSQTIQAYIENYKKQLNRYALLTVLNKIIEPIE
ncbi:unnamed protein product [Trichobilharzia regenti]|nr:unnamed protein product [Trichobilharzia regenti]